MAATQSQRAALYVSLVDSMGEEAADTLMDQLPPSGWDQMATKDDLAGVEQRLQASLAVALAEINARFAETNAEFVESHAALQVTMHEGFAQAAKERAEIIKVQARQLYVIVSAIAAATISIWIALFTSAAGPLSTVRCSVSWGHELERAAAAPGCYLF
ncbi:MAG: hypothetical protein J4F50_02310 [Acidimicrobiia bacterium]|nr:hypothetical protein [Acidimicrobiia bacterium]